MTPTPLHLLVVEDHAPLREQLVALLKRAGHRVEEADDGRLAIAIAQAETPDVILLDLGLPDIDGIDLCTRLRNELPQRVPILMLTARDTLQDKLAGFGVGADDYLVKPFASEELLARVLAVARRADVSGAYVQAIGSLTIDRRAREAHRDGVRLALTPTAFSILSMLADVYPRALTRSEVVRRLWGDDAPESDPLRTHLYQLRQAIDKPFAVPMLKTVHGVGFRLEADQT
jgi:DNA-binding response OmpR family regulator